MFDRLMNLIPICDILIQELEEKISSSQTNLPPDYCFKSVQSLLLIDAKFENFQEYCIENYLINIKRALLFLVGYVIVECERSANLFIPRKNKDKDEYEKCLKVNHSMLINKYLFVKNSKPFLDLNGNDLSIKTSKDSNLLENLVLFSCCKSEQDIFTRGRQIHSVMNMLEALNAIDKSYLYFVFLFKEEIATIDDVSELLDPYFDSMELKTCRDDQYEAKYNSFNFILKVTKIMTNYNKALDQYQKLEIIQQLVKKRISKFLESFDKTSDRDFHQNKISKQKDLKKSFKSYLKKIKMLKEIVMGHTWQNCEDDMDQVLFKIHQVHSKIQNHPKNPILQSYDKMKY